MSKKIMVLLLSVSLLAATIMAVVNPSSVMALAGLSSIDAKTLQNVQEETIKNVSTGMNDLYQKLIAPNVSYLSDDKVVNIKASKGDTDITVKINADASKLPYLDYKDIGRVLRVAQNYLKPIFNEKQASGLCSLLIGDAYAQHRKGIKDIKIEKKYDDITISCSGNTGTGLFEINLKSTVGVKKCQPSKRRILMEMRVLPH